MSRLKTYREELEEQRRRQKQNELELIQTVPLRPASMLPTAAQGAVPRVLPRPGDVSPASSGVAPVRQQAPAIQAFKSSWRPPDPRTLAASQVARERAAEAARPKPQPQKRQTYSSPALDAMRAERERLRAELDPQAVQRSITEAGLSAARMYLGSEGIRAEVQRAESEAAKKANRADELDALIRDTEYTLRTAGEKASLESVRTGSDFSSTVAAARSIRPDTLARGFMPNDAELLVKSLLPGSKTAYTDPNALYLTQGEIDTILYYAGKGDYEAVGRYYKSISRDLTSRAQAQREQFVDSLPKPVQAGLSLVTGLAAPGAMLETGAQAIKNAATGQYEPVDLNAGNTAAVRMTNRMRENTLENAGPVGHFLGQTAYSMADMATKMTLGPGTLLAVGLSAGGQSTVSALERGATPGQALGSGLLSGGIEILTEKLPLDSLFAMAKGGTKLLSRAGIGNILRQAGIEATEELISEYANTLTDIKIMGDKSEYWQYRKQLEDGGMSPDDAKKQANAQFFVVNPGLSAAGGALSGGVFGAGGTLAGQMKDSQDIAALKNLGLSEAEAKQVVQARHEAAGEGKNPQQARPDTGAQFSIQTDRDGKRYVKVDTDQEIFEGKTKKEQTNAATQYIRERFVGKELPLETTTNKRAAEEYTHPNRTLPADTMSAKLRAATELDNLLEVSEYVSSLKDDGRHAIASEGWDYYRTKFMVNGVMYEGLLNVANSPRGRIIYDVTNINGSPAHSGKAGAALTPNKPAAYSGEPTDSIIQSGERYVKSQQPSLEFQRAQELGRRLGRHVELADLPAHINGYARDGVIVLNKNSASPAVTTLAHELTHTVESSGHYKQLADLVLGDAGLGALLQKRGVTLDEMTAGVKADYAEAGVTLDDNGARHELVAKYVEEYLLTDEQSINDLVRRDRTLGQKIRDWLAGVWRSLTGTDEQRLLARAYNLYAKALSETTGPNGAALPVPETGQYSASREGFENETLEQMIDRFGAIKPGESPARDIQVPKRTEPGTKTRQFVRTAAEAAAIPDDMLSDLGKEIANGSFAYSPISDKAAVANAGATIDSLGFEGALEKFKASINGNNVASKYDIALGETLLAEAAKSGDFALTNELIADIAAVGTKAGQAVQAMRLLKRTTPEGKAHYIKKVVDQINSGNKNKSGDFRRGRTEVSVDETLMNDLLSSKSPSDADSAVNKIEQNIADQMPARWIEKWNAWRYFAMLANPRTHIRNLVGNAVFIPARKIKNLLAAGMEVAFLRDAPRSKSADTFTKEYRALKSFAKGDVANVQAALTGSGKEGLTGGIQEKRRIFKTRWLEALRRFNMNALEWEDAVFLKAAYADSLAVYLRANGYTTETINNGSEKSKLAMEDARNYAINEAQRATYRDASALADGLNKLSRSNAVAGVIVEGLLPFKKTPGNILKRGVEYSPVGLIKGLTYDLLRVKNNKITAQQAIDSIASGLTGTGILAFGMWLASIGLLRGASSDDKKERAQEYAEGEQPYSIEINGKTYTLDWMAPVSLPLFVGAEIYKLLKESKPGESFARMMDTLTRISEPMVDMSMLQGINSAIQAAAYGTSPASEILTRTALGYASQGIPTLFGQIARTIDPTPRTTYIDKQGAIPQLLQRAVQDNMKKIPGLSTLLPARVSQSGETGGEHTNVAGRAVQNFLSPGYLKDVERTPAGEEMKRLYNLTGETSVMPSSPVKSFRYNNETIYFDATQFLNYSTVKGRKTYEVLGAVVANPQYARMTTEEQVKLVSDVHSYANAVAKASVASQYEPETWVKKAQEAERRGVPIGDYLILRSQMRDLEKDAQRREVLLDSQLSEKQKRTAYVALISDKHDEKIAALRDAGLGFNEYLEVYNAYSGYYDMEIKEADKATEFAHWLDGQGYSDEQWEAVADNFKFFNQVAAKPRGYRLGLMSDNAKKRWARVQKAGYTEEEYAEYYPLFTQSGKKKAEIIVDAMAAGLSRGEAMKLWALIRGTTATKTGVMGAALPRIVLPKYSETLGKAFVLPRAKLP